VTIENILNDAIEIIKQDIQNLKESINSGPLDNKEAAKLTDYTKTLITASKNDREISKIEGLNNISDDELEKLANEALKTIGRKDNEEPTESS